MGSQLSTRLLRVAARCFRLLLVAVLLAAAVNARPAMAQNAEGVIGWKPNSGPTSDTFGSADEACEAEWKYWMNNGFSRYQGYEPDPNDWTSVTCKWTGYQNLCPQETNGGLGCGTIFPGAARFYCATGYTPTVDGHCRKNPQLEKPCDCKQDGKINPTVGQPIVVGSGAKWLEASDYSTADGQFAIEREYRSFQVGLPLDGKILPRSQPRGLTGGWNFNFAYEVQLGKFSGSPSTPSARVAVMLPDGTGYAFVLQSSGAWVADLALGTADMARGMKLEFVGTLPANLADVTASSSTWKFTDRDDRVWTLQTRAGPNSAVYNTAWPNQMVARGGYTWNFTYNTDSSLATITDSFGRSASFTWAKHYLTTLATPPAGSLPYPIAISSISLPDATSLRYTYDPAPATSPPTKSQIRRLIKVEHLNAASAVLDSTSYLYEDDRFPTHVTGIVDNRGVRIRNYGYDLQGRATLTQVADGANSHKIVYGTNGTALTAQDTTPLGKVTTYNFAAFGAGTADYRLTQMTDAANASTPASTTGISYGSDTFIGGMTDAEGRVQTMVRDARGRLLSITEGVGTPQQRTTTITWNPNFNVPATIVRAGLTESYQYDTSGRLSTATYTDTTTQTVPYSTNGQTRTYTYTWNPAGRLLSINGSRPVDALGHDDTTTFTYDAQGNLQTQTNALGQTVGFSAYDANGRPGSMTDANGVVTSFTYDGLGRVLTITNQAPGNPPLNAVTTIAYDPIGQITSLTSPATEALLFDYDNANRVIAIRATNGERRDFTYDLAGNVTSQTVRRSDGTRASRIDTVFDDLSRITSVTSGAGHTGKLGYDRTDNLVSSISPNKATTTQSFDALSRLVQVAAPDGGTSTVGYDAKDNVISATDPVTITTQFTYNGFGEVIREVSPDRGTNTYWYNEAGQLTQSSDGRGQVIAYTRDYLGRVTSKTPSGRPASEIITYTWDTGGLAGSYGVGRLGRIDDGSGTTLFQYDHRGNLLAKQQTIGASANAQLAYTYDTAERITQIAYPSGRLVRYSYDSKGRVSQVDTKASVAVVPWTPVAAGLTYEPFAAIKSMALGNGLAVSNDWGSDGRLSARRLYRTFDNTSLSYLAYRYDGNDNIAAIDDQLGPGGSQLYGYDQLDRLNFTLLQPGSTAGTTSYTYTPGTNRLGAVNDASGARTIAYDARGNTAAETRPGGITAATAYDGYARLTSYSRSDAGSYAFTYNGLDDRVTMDLPGAGTRRFVYDADGRVMGEYGLSAADVKAEYIWLSPELGADGAFGGDDGLGGYMPLAVATPDSGGTVQLTWVHGNHLGVPLITTDANGIPITGMPDYLAPGFPGQSRVIADLYYNRYRDYDPSTGRYIQADPIGLGGGSNPYGYAGVNPVTKIDPKGQSALALAGGLGEALGGEAIGSAGVGAFCLEPVGWVVCGGGAVGVAVYVGYNYLKRCGNDGGFGDGGVGANSGGGRAGGGDPCVAGWIYETEVYCPETFGGNRKAFRHCIDRANDRLWACKHNGGRWPPEDGPDPWSWQDEHRFRP
jgi:RHS repeat-associated protein